jgi:superfamily II DNA/RNA helicase
VLELRDNDWFSRGVALAEECNTSVVDHSIQWLRNLREGGTPHQLIAVACSLAHARQIRGLYQERGIEAREIHSGMSHEDQEQVLRDLRNGVIDAVVQVQMLGEGFDHPPLSVAAIFRPFRSLSPYIQFVGRIMRVNVQNAPGHPDNLGVVVSHVGMNIDRHWEDFKEIDRQDQELVHDWIEAGEVAPEGGGEGGGRRRLTADMVVTQEILDSFLSDPYLDPDDETVIDNAMDVLREQGLDLEDIGLTREELQRRLRQRKAQLQPDTPERLPVQPQAHRQMLRERLREQTQSAASRICEAVGHRQQGQGIAALGGTGAANNLAAVITLMNREVNQYLAIGTDERRDLTTEQLEAAIAEIDALADKVEAHLRERL